LSRTAAIQLSNDNKHPSKGDTIRYIHTDSQHKNPLCRVVSIDSIDGNKKTSQYDKEKYKEMILDAAETVLGYFGSDRTIYGVKKNTSARKLLWTQELRRDR
jgi:DNA polymerase elongation subunit (family B)